MAISSKDDNNAVNETLEKLTQALESLTTAVSDLESTMGYYGELLVDELEAIRVSGGDDD